jgi:ParB family chromosome partitioning protein
VAEQVIRLDIERISPNRHQPRQQFDETALEALARSIRQAGLMQPVLVRPDADGSFSLIAGERRWRAARLAGLSSIPAIVRHADDRQSAEMALIENLQREDLNPIERATAFKLLIEDHDLTHQQVADAVGLDRSSVTNLLRLLDLEDSIKTAVAAGALGMGHARALLAIANSKRREHLAGQAIRKGWSVRELERRARQLAIPAGGSKSTRAIPPHMQDLQRRLGEHLGTNVRIVSGRKKGSGTISIEFYSLDQFDGLVQRMGFRLE